MLQDLTPASFEAHLNTPFQVHYGDSAPLEIVLSEVRLLEPHPGPRAQPFSLYFLGPGSPVLRQHTFKLTHEPLGELDLFLVPVGPHPKKGGMLYEAVFN
jgi:uncharacterized protein DUF6916